MNNSFRTENINFLNNESEMSFRDHSFREESPRRWGNQLELGNRSPRSFIGGGQQMEVRRRLSNNRARGHQIMDYSRERGNTPPQAPPRTSTTQRQQFFEDNLEIIVGEAEKEVIEEMRRVVGRCLEKEAGEYNELLILMKEDLEKEKRGRNKLIEDRLVSIEKKLVIWDEWKDREIVERKKEVEKLRNNLKKRKEEKRIDYLLTHLEAHIDNQIIVHRKSSSLFRVALEDIQRTTLKHSTSLPNLGNRELGESIQELVSNSKHFLTAQSETNTSLRLLSDNSQELINNLSTFHILKHQIGQKRKFSQAFQESLLIQPGGAKNRPCRKPKIVSRLPQVKLEPGRRVMYRKPIVNKRKKT